jgi:hypothetical protein
MGLVLVDSSSFDWLGIGTPLFLLGAIDDATSCVLALDLRFAEDLHGYLTLVQQVVTQDGVPVTLYGDRLGVSVRRCALASDKWPEGMQTFSLSRAQKKRDRMTHRTK